MKTKFESLGLTPKKDALTPEQIAAVKGLGSLRDKRFDDVFNIRVLTTNGKISTDAHRAVAQAAVRITA